MNNEIPIDATHQLLCGEKEYGYVVLYFKYIDDQLYGYDECDQSGGGWQKCVSGCMAEVDGIDPIERTYNQQLYVFDQDDNWVKSKETTPSKGQIWVNAILVQCAIVYPGAIRMYSEHDIGMPLFPCHFNNLNTIYKEDK